MNENIYKKVSYLLEIRDLSIPEIWERINSICDSYDIQKIIGKLIDENKVELKRFVPYYNEDGGLLHIAVYGKIR